MKEIKPETNRPKGNLPYQDVNRPFRMQFVIPGPGIKIEQDKNGVLYISAEGGASVSDIIAGDNIEIERREDGAVVISAVNSVANISAGENVTITVDPVTGASVINSIIGGETNEHYKGVFDTTEDLIAADPDPEIGDYGLIKSLTITNGETSWSGQYKYCFFINGAWTVVDQMLTFTKNLDLLQQYYSVGGSSPVIYLHEIARSGNFWDLNNIPIVATPEVTVEGTTVTVTCATEGAEIWYTTDGSMPHVNGTKYTGPITVSEATTFRFVGIKNGMINSLEATASADYELQAPVIELDWHTGLVSMSNPNLDGSGNPIGNIFYARNGGSVKQYSSPIQEHGTSGFFINYVAYISDGSKQSVTTEVVFEVCGEGITTFSNAETGVVSYFARVLQAPTNNNYNTAEDGEVHYTLDGSTPTYNSGLLTSTLYANRFGPPSTVIKCKFYRPGYIPGKERSAVFGNSSPSAPSVSYNSETGLVTLLRAGNVMTSPEIPLKTTPDDPTIGCRIYYTLDGSTPTDQSTLYTGPFQISGNTTVKAVLIAYGQYSSDVSQLEIQVMAQPQFSLDWHTGNVSMTNPNEEGTIYYTLDGSEPTASSNIYSAPVTLTNNTTVKAKVIAETGSSATATQTFTRAQAPKINDGNVSLTYNLNILTGIYDVKMNTSQQGGVIRYTSLPGHFPADPTWSDNQFVDELSAPFFEEWTFEARTFAEGFIPSAVVTQTFGIDSVHPVLINYDEDSATVSFHRQWFTAQIPLQTNNNTPELGCRVYFTLDGSTPDDKSTLWDGNPVSVAPGTTVKALLVCYGQYESEVSTYNVPGGVEYLYFEAAQANSTVSLMSTLETAPDLEYSTDGNTWQTLEYTESEIDGKPAWISDNITLSSVGEKVWFRGNNPAGLGNPEPNRASIFNFTGSVDAKGNIMSLIDKSGNATEVPVCGFFMLFSGVITPSNLRSAQIMDNISSIGDCGCYMMFSSSAISEPPRMDNLKTIGVAGAGYMFEQCANLESAANMPAIASLAERACEYMYDECSFDMSDDGTTLNFDFPTPPVTAGNTTYDTAYDVAEWMGNTNGF